MKSESHVKNVNSWYKIYIIFKWKIVEIQRSLSFSGLQSLCECIVLCLLVLLAHSASISSFWKFTVCIQCDTIKRIMTHKVFIWDVLVNCKQKQTHSTSSVAYSQNKLILLLNNSKTWLLNQNEILPCIGGVGGKLTQWCCFGTTPFLPDCEKEKWKAPIKNCFWLVEI